MGVGWQQHGIGHNWSLTAFPVLISAGLETLFSPDSVFPISSLSLDSDIWSAAFR